MVLEGSCPPQMAAAVAQAWQAVVADAATALAWHGVRPVARRRDGHLTLAFTAPPALLLTATELNEWAWDQALAATGLPVPPPALSPGDLPRDPPGAMHQLRALAAIEATAPQAEIARPADPGQRIALVTGSNGKTTTTRLIAAMTTAQGWRTGWSCTDGVFVAGAGVERGDWSGPGGAQRVVREPGVVAAILETARGGILRRGLGVTGARAAIVTNVQADHFGEYGMFTLADLAEVKLTVAKGLRASGVLVLNGDDPSLRTVVPPPHVEARWFAATPTPPRAPPPAAWCDAGRLYLRDGGQVLELGAVADLPLTAGGSARYNVANILAAVLGAQALGVAPAVMREVLARFGRDPGDNPGRLAHYRLGGVDLLVDYAHNPAGLAGLLDVARALTPRRMLVLLGQAGNRDDDALAALAATAWAAGPDRVILKELDGYQRGRGEGEVPRRLAAILRSLGARDEQLEVVLDEAAAAAAALEWSRPGDVLVLPIHALDARDRVTALLAERGAVVAGWNRQAG